MGRRQVLNNIVNTVIDFIKKDAPVNKVAADIPPIGLLNDAHVQTKIMDGPAKGYIYNILDTKNGKNYVGSKLGAIDKTEDYLGSGTIIKRIANKRPDDLYKTILGKTSTRREMMTQEEAWLKAMRAAQDDNMYNLKNSYRGSTGRIPPNKGKKMSEAQKIKLRESSAKRWAKDSERKKASNSHKGKVWTDEQKEKLSNTNKGKAPSNKGKSMSDEQKLKISKALAGKVPHNKGKKGISDETRKKMSEAQTRRQKGLL